MQSQETREEMRAFLALFLEDATKKEKKQKKKKKKYSLHSFT